MSRLKTGLPPLLIAALLQLHLLPVPAVAQTDIRLWPTRVEMEADVGGSAEKAVTVQNPSRDCVTVHVYAMDFTVDREGNFTLSEPGHESYSCSSWLSVDESSFELEAGETRAVEVTLCVPGEVEPGGHHAALLFEGCPTQTEADSPVSVRSRVASLFYVTISSVSDADIIADAEIVSLTLPGHVEGSSTALGVVIRNTGNVHLNVAGMVYLTGFRGRRIGEVDLGQTIILPGCERVLEGEFSDLPLVDRVIADVVIGYFDDGGDLVNKDTQAAFWVTPHRGFVAAGVMMLGLAILATLRFRRKYRLKIEPRV